MATGYQMATTLYDISIQQGNSNLEWENYLAKDDALEADVEGAATLKTSEKDIGSWSTKGKKQEQKVEQKVDDDGLVEQDVYGLCFKNIPESMSWKAFWKFANVEKKRVAGAMRVGKTDIVVFFKNPNHATECFNHTNGKSVDGQLRGNLGKGSGNVKGSGGVAPDAATGDAVKVWWLDRDPKRVVFIDKMVVPNQKEWDFASNYVHSVLPDPNDATCTLYSPITEDINNHTTISTLFDGSCLCLLLNSVIPYFIDPRTIHIPNETDPSKANPLEVWQVRENVQLLLSSAKAMGLELNSYETNLWFSPDTHVNLVIEIIKQLSKKGLENYVTPRKSPELIQLAQGDEHKDKDVLKQVPSDQWIERWLNHHNGANDINAEIRDADFSNDLFITMGKIEPNFSKNAPGSYSNNPKEGAKAMIDYAKNQMNIDTNVTADDLANNNRQCQNLFAAQIYDKNNGLPQLSDKQKKANQNVLKKDKPSADAAMVSWINSIMPPGFRITNLYRDMSDGLVLLHLLDKAQPGVVVWKRNVTKKVKNKFHKVGNCNYAIKLCTTKFPFSLVGIGGTDIVDGHQKFIHTLLWQLMRYHATKALANLSFGGKEVKDDQIVAWANKTIKQLPDAHSKAITSFKDRHLSTCYMYLEILLVIDPTSVKKDLIHFIPMLKGNADAKTDEYFDKRLENARYAMSLVRRLGGELFVLPEDLIICEPKAVLSVMAALMTIAFSDKDDRNANEADQQLMDAAEEAVMHGTQKGGKQKGMSG